LYAGGGRAVAARGRLWEKLYWAERLRATRARTGGRGTCDCLLPAWFPILLLCFLRDPSTAYGTALLLARAAVHGIPPSSSRRGVLKFCCTTITPACHLAICISLCWLCSYCWRCAWMQDATRPSLRVCCRTLRFAVRLPVLLFWLSAISDLVCGGAGGAAADAAAVHIHGVPGGVTLCGHLPRWRVVLRLFMPPIMPLFYCNAATEPANEQFLRDLGDTAFPATDADDGWLI